MNYPIYLKSNKKPRNCGVFFITEFNKITYIYKKILNR